jgi:hypothetical protein
MMPVQQYQTMSHINTDLFLSKTNYVVNVLQITKKSYANSYTDN